MRTTCEQKIVEDDPLLANRRDADALAANHAPAHAPAHAAGRAAVHAPAHAAEQTHAPGTTSKLVLTKNHSADQRSNLKRAYAWFVHNGRGADSSKSAPSPTEAWPMRPYAAFV